MTPEKAQELLDYHAKMHGFDITIDEIENLLKQFAGLRYEYAVQIPHPLGGWSYIIIDRETDEHSMTPHPHWADWEDNLDDAQCVAESLERARVVRRLMADPEVVE